MDDRPKRKRKNWSEADEIRLLGIWEESVKELKRYRRNSHVYARMAANFPDHTAGEVHIKISNFTQKYRSEKKNCEGPDATPSSWKYYAIVDRILGPMTNGEKSETPEDAEDGENSDFEELPEGFTFKEEVDSEMASNSSQSPPHFPQTILSHPLEAAIPALRIPLFIPPSLSGSQDSPASSPTETTAQAGTKGNRTRATLQKEALKIARENQELLRQQIAFSREAIREQFTMIAHSIELIKESTENSRIFAAKICEISERQLELESTFMGFMKEILSKKMKRKRKVKGRLAR